LILPLSSLPWGVRWVSYLIPCTYAQGLIKAMAAGRNGIFSHLDRFGLLILYGLGLLFLSGLTLRQRS
jgi:hypothetical protein